MNKHADKNKKAEEKKTDFNASEENLSPEMNETLEELTEIEEQQKKMEQIRNLGINMFEGFKKSQHMLKELHRQLRLTETNPVTLLIAENDEIIKLAEEVEKLAEGMQK